MDENNPEKSSINGAKINLFHSSEIYNNVCEFDNKTEIKTDSKLENTATITKRISKPSTSQQLACIKNKNPIKKQLKGKFKIISVVHIPKLINDKIEDERRNRYIPLILKKNNKLKLKSKSKNQKAISNMAASTPKNSVRNSPVVINSVLREALNISKQLEDKQESSTGNAMLSSKELVIPVENSDKMENEELDKVIPYNISGKIENYFTKSNIQTYNYRHLTNDVCDKHYYFCPMAQHPDEELSTNRKFGSVVTIQGAIADINLNGNDSNNSDTSCISSTSSSGIASTINSDEQIVNSVEKNVQQPPKSIKINRFVSILKSNQPNANSTNGRIETDTSTEMESESETSPVSGSSETPESGVSFLSETLSSEKLTTSYASEKSSLVDETDSFKTVSEIISETETVSSENELTFGSDTISPETKATFATEISPEIDLALQIKIDSSEIKNGMLKIEAVSPKTETVPSKINTEMVSPQTKAENETTAGSPRPEVFETEASSPSEMKGTFEAEEAEIGAVVPETEETVPGIEKTVPGIEGKVVSGEIDATLRNKKASFDETETEENVYDSRKASSSKMEIEMKSKANTSELVTVASDDIPYNAEVEIDSNNNAGDNVTPLTSNNYGKRKANEDDLDFDVLKKRNKRRLFLEREDVEFCRAAQRKVKGIGHFGVRGFSAIGKFNEILKLIPDESPATIHALMVACKNKVAPVLDHLRYIQETREILRNQRKYSSSSSSSIDDTPYSDPLQQNKTNPEVEARAKTDVYIPNTRKKKIAYDVDLSDNYPDDSDEDYYPGKDLTPRKKKRCKRRYFSSSKSKVLPLPFEDCKLHKTPINIQLFKTQNENEQASTSTSTSENLLGKQHHHPISSLNRCEDADEKRIIRYGKTGNPRERKRQVIDLLKKNDAVYKAEPMHPEVLELAKFKNKRNPNSYTVPPLQKFKYTHEGVENFRYMTITKQ